MDKATIRDYLAQAEKRVRLGLVHIAKQRAIIAKLGRDGLDATMARELLNTLEKAQTLHVADRDRLMKELAEAE